VSNLLVDSDARTGNIFEDRIRPVLETGSAVGGSKPVLVVIDEIDGATGGGDNVSLLIQRKRII
jgi:chromosome transmission fidelity protein 18